MSQSLVRIYIHLVFSTKDRYPFITAEWKNKLYAYMAGILKRDTASTFHYIGGMKDHIHILFCLSKNKSLSDVIHTLKGRSSVWMKENGIHKFAWQGGYAAFSVSESIIEATKKYILNQEKHHEKFTFTEEVAHFCKLYKIDQYDENYFTQG